MLPKGDLSTPVHMIRLTATLEIRPYTRVHLDEER
jgi:hypothetical protein